MLLRNYYLLYNIHRSAITLEASAYYCVSLPCAGKTVLTQQLMDSEQDL